MSLHNKIIYKCVVYCDEDGRSVEVKEPVYKNGQKAVPTLFIAHYQMPGVGSVPIPLKNAINLHDAYKMFDVGHEQLKSVIRQAMIAGKQITPEDYLKITGGK